MTVNRTLTTLLGLVLMLALTAVLTAYAVSSSPSSSAATVPGDASTGVHVTGVGTVSGTPDVLRFTVGVEVSADTVDAALTSAGDSATRVIASLKDRGIDAADLQTANVDVQPRYDANGQQVTGYVVRQDVTVKVRDLATAGATITAAVQAGGDAARLHGVTFSLEDNEELLSAARSQAFAQAKTTAQQHAKLAGLELGDVVSVDETLQQGDPAPYPMAATAAMAMVPVEPGSTQVRVQVDVRWGLR